MFSRKISIILIAALLLGLFPNSWLTETVHAAPLTVSLDPVADVMYDLSNGTVTVTNNDLAGRFYAGRDLYTGVYYISRGALRFNLDSSGPLPGTPIKYELQIHVIAKEVAAGDTFYLDVWGSDNNTMLDTNTTFPTWSTSTSVHKIDGEISNGTDLTFDVTSLVANNSSPTDRNVTFVITGNEAANDSRIIGGLKEETTLSYRPHLIITYVTNQPPTGSITINGGASHTNSTNATLNLTGVDPESNPMEMNFSNDNSTWSGWEAYSSTKSWALTSGDGSKTVYYQLRDNSLAVSPVYSDTIMLDTVKPTVTGVTYGGLYKVDKMITFDEGTATLDGSAFATGSTVSTVGSHSLIVTDTAGNSTTVTFTIDKSNPVVTGVAEGGLYKVEKTIIFDEGTATLDGVAFTSGLTVTTETPNPHVLVVTDAAGNSTTVNFRIDKTAPIVTGVANGLSYNSDRNITFNDGTATLNTAPFTSGTTVSAEDAYTLIVTDLAGNITTIAFKIDKTNPVVTGVTDGGLYKIDKTITFYEGTATLDGVPFTSGSTVTTETPNPHVLIVTDAATNSTTVNFVIDKTAPTVTGVTDGESYKVDKVVTFSDGTATMNSAAFSSGNTVSAEDNYSLAVTDLAGNITTVGFTIDKTNPVVTGVSDGGSYSTNKTVTFNEGTATLNGSTFISGTTISTGGNYTLVVTDAASNRISVGFTIAFPTPVPGPVGSDNKIEIIINGVVQDQVVSATTETVDGDKVTTITVDEDKLIQELNSEPNKPTIIIPINNGSDVVVGELNGRIIETLDNKKASIQVQTGNASYTIAANQFNMNNVKKDFGPDIPLQDIKISIEIKNVPDYQVDFIQNRTGKITLVAPAVEFSITATHDGKTVEINKFHSFVERTIAIPEGVDPKKITTGVVVAEDGKLISLPTRIIEKDGRYYAVIYSLTNSVYTVIYNEKTFTDITNHWAKTSIEDLAARLILQGVTEQQFQPNKEITRAEFTAIIVRALGLRTIEQSIEFKDVQKKDWFYDAVSIAVSNGLVEGNKDNTFKPNQKLTREEAMVILYNAMKIAGMDLMISVKEVNEKLSTFKDSNQFKSSSRTAAALTVKFGIINGSNGIALPAKIITRAETAKIIQLFLQQAKLI